ncbi:MAG: hypothetical protein LBO67_03655 [Spirochaetaceae bacterium]|nr:hypothetical protein [Spirochaetaceae bacterium]
MIQSLYKERHRIKNVFRWLKQRCGITTQYAQRIDFFLATFSVSSIFLSF